MEEQASIVHKFDQPINAISVDSSGSLIALGGRRGVLVTPIDTPWDVQKSLATATRFEITTLEWCPHISSKSLIATTGNRTTEIWDASSDSHSPIAILGAHQRVVSDVGWCADEATGGRIVATCSQDTNIFVWDLRDSRRPCRTFCAWTAGASALRWNYCSPTVIASAHDGEVRLWDMRSSSSSSSSSGSASSPAVNSSAAAGGSAGGLQFITAHMAKIVALDWSRTSPNDLVTAGQDKQIKFWNVQTPREHKGLITLGYPASRVRFAQFASGCQGLLTSAQRPDNTVRLWNVINPASAVNIAAFGTHYDTVRSFDFSTVRRSENGDVDLVTWSKDQHLRVFKIDQNLQAACTPAGSIMYMSGSTAASSSGSLALTPPSSPPPLSSSGGTIYRANSSMPAPPIPPSAIASPMDDFFPASYVSASIHSQPGTPNTPSRNGVTPMMASASSSSSLSSYASYAGGAAAFGSSSSFSASSQQHQQQQQQHHGHPHHLTIIPPSPGVGGPSAVPAFPPMGSLPHSASASSVASTPSSFVRSSSSMNSFAMRVSGRSSPASPGVLAQPASGERPALSLTQECTQIANTFRGVVSVEEMNAISRTCQLGISVRGQNTTTGLQQAFYVRLRVVFPQLYPYNAAPSFEFLAQSNISLQLKKRLLSVLTTTAQFFVSENRNCLEDCINAAWNELQSAVQGVQPPPLSSLSSSLSAALSSSLSASSSGLAQHLHSSLNRSQSGSDIQGPNEADAGLSRSRSGSVAHTQQQRGQMSRPSSMPSLSDADNGSDHQQQQYKTITPSSSFTIDRSPLHAMHAAAAASASASLASQSPHLLPSAPADPSSIPILEQPSSSSSSSLSPYPQPPFSASSSQSSISASSSSSSLDPSAASGSDPQSTAPASSSSSYSSALSAIPSVASVNSLSASSSSSSLSSLSNSASSLSLSASANRIRWPADPALVPYPRACLGILTPQGRLIYIAARDPMDTKQPVAVTVIATDKDKLAESCQEDADDDKKTKKKKNSNGEDKSPFYKFGRSYADFLSERIMTSQDEQNQLQHVLSNREKMAEAIFGSLSSVSAAVPSSMPTPQREQQELAEYYSSYFSERSILNPSSSIASPVIIPDEHHLNKDDENVNNISVNSNGEEEPVWNGSHSEGSEEHVGIDTTQLMHQDGLPFTDVHIYDISGMLGLDVTIASEFKLCSSKEDAEEACSHNAQLCSRQGRPDLSRVFQLLPQLLPPFSLIPSSTAPLFPWSLHPFSRSLFEDIVKRLEQERDVQTLGIISAMIAAATPVSAASSSPNSCLFEPKRMHVYDFYRISYGSILESLGLSHQRSRLMKHVERLPGLPSPSNGALSSVAALFSLGAEMECSRCRRRVVSGKCTTCRKQPIRCSMCSLSVRGMALVCPVCGHGGHVSHMAEWFEKSSVCPVQSCGCSCVSQMPVNLANPSASVASPNTFIPSLPAMQPRRFDAEPMSLNSGLPPRGGYAQVVRMGSSSIYA